MRPGARFVLESLACAALGLAVVAGAFAVLDLTNVVYIAITPWEPLVAWGALYGGCAGALFPLLARAARPPAGAPGWGRIARQALARGVVLAVVCGLGRAILFRFRVSTYFGERVGTSSFAAGAEALVVLLCATPEAVPELWFLDRPRPAWARPAAIGATAVLAFVALVFGRLQGAYAHEIARTGSIEAALTIVRQESGRHGPAAFRDVAASLAAPFIALAVARLALRPSAFQACFATLLGAGLALATARLARSGLGFGALSLFYTTGEAILLAPLLPAAALAASGVPWPRRVEEEQHPEGVSASS